MSNPTTARDDLIALVRTAWLANPATSAIPLAFDDVQFTRPTGVDANGHVLPWARVTVRHFTTETETIGGEGLGKDQHEGIVRVEVRTAAGYGRRYGDQYAQIAKAALQRKRITDGWTFEARIFEGLEDGPWVVTNAEARFRYSEQL